MKNEILQPIRQLVLNYHECIGKEWQSVSIDNKNPLVEIQQVFIKNLDIQNPLEDINPDLPWAEDHFKERINGKPINPGNEYKNWPYYKGEIDNDKTFRADGKFSHNYMERYWCKGIKGRRFDYGDLDDIISRLKKEKGTRQAYLSVWHPEDQSNHGERVPCTLGYWFYLNKDKLDVTYHIRSCDAVRHYRNDIYMTWRLLQYVASKASFDVGNMNIWIGSFHCFKSDLYTLKKLIK